MSDVICDLTSLHMIISRSIHVAANYIILFFFIKCILKYVLTKNKREENVESFVLPSLLIDSTEYRS